MTNEEKLLLAIGEIDDILIAEASTNYNRRSTPLTRGLSIAASVVAVSAVVLATSTLFAPKSFDSNSMAGGSAPTFGESAEDADGGDYSGTVESEYGYIYNIVKMNDYKIQFCLEILYESTKEFDVVILGENAEEQKSAICTSGEINGKYALVLAPVITVNGEEASALPTAKGAYTVTVDYSVIANTDFTWNDYIEILNLGRIER